MKTKILNMIRFAVVLTAMLIMIGVGIYALVYSLIHAAIYIGIFILGIAGLSFGLFTLHTVSEKLK